MFRLTFEKETHGKELLINTTSIKSVSNFQDDILPKFYMICFLEKADGTFELDTQKIQLKDNTILFLIPGQIAKPQLAQIEKGFILFFEGEFLDIFFNDSFFILKFAFFHDAETPAAIQFAPKVFGEHFRVVSEIHEEIRNLQPDSEHLLRSLLYYLLIKLNRVYTTRYSNYNNIITNQHLLRFKHLLEKNVRKNYNVQEYAQELGISRVYLNHICNKFLGYTSHHTIKSRLLLEAKREIIYTEKEISEIAYDLHFNAPSHFVRFFKQYTDKTPQQFRREFYNRM